MSWWLIAIVVYGVALAAVVGLAAGVKRADRMRERSPRPLARVGPQSSRMGTPPRSGRELPGPRRRLANS